MPEHVLSDDWVKTENGCEFLTSNTDASNVTWDGECLDGKVHGEGKLVIYKNDQLFYELTGVYENGKPRKGEINWADDDNYANYVWLKNNLDNSLPNTPKNFALKLSTQINITLGVISL